MKQMTKMSGMCTDLAKSTLRADQWASLPSGPTAQQGVECC